MKLSQRAAFGAAFAAITLTTLSPIAAKADGFNWGNHNSWGQGLQNNKNTWRNLAIGAGAVAAIGLLNHNNTEAALGAVGAAVSASQYEKDRHQQSQENNGWYDNRGYGNWNRDNWNRDNHNYDRDHRDRW